MENLRCTFTLPESLCLQGVFFVTTVNRHFLQHRFNFNLPERFLGKILKM
jgi:hypothetical protein